MGNLCGCTGTLVYLLGSCVTGLQEAVHGSRNLGKGDRRVGGLGRGLVKGFFWGTG